MSGDDQPEQNAARLERELASVRAVIESANEAYFMVDDAGIVCDCNAAAERLFGWRREELVGRSGVELLAPPERQDEYHALRDELVASGEAREYELTAVHRDGRALHLHASAWLTPDADDTLVHVLCRDVTETVELLGELHARTRQLEHAQRLAGIGTWQWDITTGRVSWSEECARIFGAEAEKEPSYETFASRLHPDDRHGLERWLRQAVAGGSVPLVETRLRLPDGSERWITFEGDVTEAGRAFGVVQDVTDRKRREEELLAANARFAAGFEHSPLGIVLWRPTTGAFLVNRIAARILGRDRAEVVGKHPEDVIHPDDLPYASSLIGALMTRELDVAEAELRIVHPDGKVVWTEVTASVVPGDDPHLFVYLQDVTDLRATRTELLQRANQDPLTGLANRSRFREVLTEALLQRRPDRSLAVLLLDLDGFKDINDGLGHHAGDVVLKEAALRLGAALPAGDLVARLGGDEFAIVVPELATPEDALVAAGAVQEALAAPFDVGGMKVHLGGSIGIALAPDDGDDASGLLQKADVAMYRSKALRTPWALYRPEHDDLALDRLALVTDLRAAIVGDELEVAFQPLVAAASQRAMSVEALARWRHPERGPVTPDQFIPLAEQVGLITPLTRVVLRKALAACAAWTTRGHDVRVAVNVSVHSLDDDSFPRLVVDELERAGVPARRLTLELTETSLACRGGQAEAGLQALRALGVQLAIDDFGTGYSTMSYLKDLPVEKLKIDRSFVQHIDTDPRDLAIVRSLVRLGSSLGLTVVAEGVESATALRLLADVGCDLAQGYGIARPMDADAIVGWLDSNVPAGHVAVPGSAPRPVPTSVLVVDDSPTVRHVLAREASARGWVVTEVGSAEEALAEVEREIPDAVILDHRMEGMTGIDAVPLLRARGVDGPILLFTDYLSEAMVGAGIPLDVWPVSKADLTLALDLLAAYRNG